MFFFFFFFFMITIMFMTHPFGFGGVLLVLSIFLSWGVSIMSISWYGFVLFLVFVGGLLVLFSYTCALAPMVSMEKNKINLYLAVLSLGMSLIFLGFMGSVIYNGLLSVMMDSSQLSSSVSNSKGVLVTTFIWDLSIVWLVLVLFLVMILVAYICKKQGFPLRSFSKK